MDAGYTHTHDLTRDRQYVERLQLASVKASEFALASPHGLFGSGRWWESVRDGSIPTHRVEGTIVDVRINGNWPEFEVLAEEELTTWCLEGDVKSYSVGSGVRISYVTQHYAAPSGRDEDSVKVVLKTWVAG